MVENPEYISAEEKILLFSQDITLLCVLSVSNQNGVSCLYIIVEIYHCGRKP